MWRQLWTRVRSWRVRGSGSDKPLPYTDPLSAGRHPFQTYLLLLCVVSSFPYLFGYATAEAVERNLPVLVALGWGLMLLGGSTLALVGTYWTRGYDTALTMERIGLFATGIAGVIYSLCVLAAKDVYAPFFMLLIIVGVYCFRIPLPQRLSARKQHWVEAAYVALGLVCLVVGGVLLEESNATDVLVGGFIILGFGISCLRRARDIAMIFKRAKQTESPYVLREGEI